MIKLENYKIIKKIASGGMGDVYLAEHTVLETKVAIKSLNSDLVSDEDFRKRFRKEAKTQSKLSHPNIVKLIDFQERKDGLFLIMEYIEGKQLNDYIRDVTGPMPEVKLIPLFKEILSAIQYAHNKKLIHRDIKPSNVLITNEGKPKVIDFGIAKYGDEDKGLTKTGIQVGTVSYMSPEQVNAEKLDKLTDIYSLGVMLFEMSVGKSPYSQYTNEFKIQTSIVSEPLPNAKDIYPSVSDKLVFTIEKATQKIKKDRYQSCEEFIKSLDSKIKINTKPKNNTSKVSNNVFFPFLKKYKKPISIAVLSIMLFLAIGYKVLLPYKYYNDGIAKMKSAITLEDFDQSLDEFKEVMQISKNYKGVDTLVIKTLMGYINKTNELLYQDYLESDDFIDLLGWNSYDLNSTDLKSKIFYILNKDSLSVYSDKKALYVALLRHGPGIYPFSSSDTIFWKNKWSSDWFQEQSFDSISVNNIKTPYLIVENIVNEIGSMDPLNLDYLWCKSGIAPLTNFEKDWNSMDFYYKILENHPAKAKNRYNQIQRVFKGYSLDRSISITLADSRDKDLWLAKINELIDIDKNRYEKDPWIKLVLAGREFSFWPTFYFPSNTLKSEKRKTLKLYEGVIENLRKEGFSRSFKDSIRIGSIYRTIADINNELKSYTKALINYKKASSYYPINFSPENTSSLYYSNPRYQNIYYLSTLYYESAMIKSGKKKDYLGAIRDYEKALTYWENDYKNPNPWFSQDYAWILRNLFSSKWNYKENGDKMGACDDLKLASDLDPEEYYDYYLKWCSN